MPTTSPARIDDDLYASAKLAGEAQSRSTSQQVVHWARIGREIEASGDISLRDIGEVLAGSRSYDGLNAREQALVRAEWSDRMDELRASLDFAEEFASIGRGWAELDDDGVVVERGSLTAMTVSGAPASIKPRARSRKAVGSIEVVANPATRKGSTARRKSGAKLAEAPVTKKRKAASPKAPNRPAR